MLIVLFRFIKKACLHHALVSDPEMLASGLKK